MNDGYADLEHLWVSVCELELQRLVLSFGMMNVRCAV
jgi:hypothetical protein